ncbi:hypothetical protein FE697_015310 [Mumia zhuanghuii]|uniref:Helix-turn-helix domain-containing protein n=2 Tax=Mumia TaxID=1546255 RepID=A0ABW1QQH0_9ACTN|nr:MULTISPECIES: hypothetical protein [Mumia]KAA1422500.1 hypothetical protein FE697_015310 [Mumia zhuanghuii]
MRRGLSVEYVDGVVCVVIADVDALHELAAIVAQSNSARVYRGGDPLRSAEPFVSAARACIAVRELVPGKELEPTSILPPTAVWITADQAASELGITARAVTKRAAAGGLVAKKVAGRWWINLKETTREAA